MSIVNTVSISVTLGCSVTDTSFSTYKSWIGTGGTLSSIYAKVYVSPTDTTSYAEIRVIRSSDSMIIGLLTGIASGTDDILQIPIINQPSLIAVSEFKLQGRISTVGSGKPVVQLESALFKYTSVL